MNLGTACIPGATNRRASTRSRAAPTATAPEQRAPRRRKPTLTPAEEVIALIRVYKAQRRIVTRERKAGVDMAKTPTAAFKALLAARNEVIRRNMGFVYLVARNVAWATGHSADDLVSEGVFGLFRAIDEFDESFGVRFITYAANWVRAVIGRAVERMDATMHGTLHIVTNFRRPYREYERLVLLGIPKQEALRRLASRIRSREVTPAMLARYFEVIRTMRAYSLDMPIGEHGGTMMDLVPARKEAVDEQLDAR